MFCDVDHPNVSLSEWQTFLKDLPPHLIVEVIDRSKLGLPPWFVPFARGVAIASHAYSARRATGSECIVRAAG
jgi:hypothetical protein